MEPILKVLIPKLKDPDPYPGVVISVLAAIGEQAQVRSNIFISLRIVRKFKKYSISDDFYILIICICIG